MLYKDAMRDDLAARQKSPNLKCSAIEKQRTIITITSTNRIFTRKGKGNLAAVDEVPRADRNSASFFHTVRLGQQ